MFECPSIHPLFSLAQWQKPKISKVFVWFGKSVCQNLQKYLSDFQMYFSKLFEYPSKVLSPVVFSSKVTAPKRWSTRSRGEFYFPIFELSQTFLFQHFWRFSSEKLWLLEIGQVFLKWLSSANRETVAKFKIQLLVRPWQKLEWREGRKWWWWWWWWWWKLEWWWWWFLKTQLLVSA